MGAHLDSIEIPTTLALAVMAALGYAFGTLHHRLIAHANSRSRRQQDDISRAQMAVSELEQAIGTLRNRTAEHYRRLKKFQSRVARLAASPGDAGWYELCREVDAVLDPTLQLVSEISSAEKRIRSQSEYLMAFAETPTDRLLELAGCPSARPDEDTDVQISVTQARS